LAFSPLRSYASSSRRAETFSVVSVPSRYRLDGAALDVTANSLDRWSSSWSSWSSLSRRAVVDGASFTEAFDSCGHQRRKVVGFKLMVVVEFVGDSFSSRSSSGGMGSRRGGCRFSLRSVASEHYRNCGLHQRTGRTWTSTLVKKKARATREGPFLFSRYYSNSGFLKKGLMT
jgi:hypothetical protein